MSDQSIALRGAMRAAFQATDDRGHIVLLCAWCGGNINGDFHPHHALVKSSAVRHQAVDRAIENRVPLHWTCHSEHGQSSEMTVRALDYLCERLGSARVARWYISLWNERGLSVARGTLPACTLYYKVLCDCGEGALDEFIDFNGASEQEWREYLELVCLPLCFAAQQ